ncbi:MAG: hypothetical protein PHN64_09590 [Desulfovibrionaceae bacterium]|nr:hypothetical protein [Desulfovibrionaceae bacterium]
MKKAIFLLLFILLFISGCDADAPNGESIKQASLPLTSHKWEKIDVSEGYNSDTYVLELQHGWLVCRVTGFGAGMTFVPRPENIVKTAQ